MAVNGQYYKLLACLLNAQGALVTASKLAAQLQVSTRQVRNYVTSINQFSTGSPVIASTNRGYFLNYNEYLKYLDSMEDSPFDSPISRQDFILQKLISSESINIFDLSEEIHISVPTVESDIKSIRKRLSVFSLSIKRSFDNLFLEGNESAKRKLINSLLRNNSYDSFLLKNELCLFSYQYNYDKLRENIVFILSNHHLVINDYNLNTIILHLVILIDRIRNNNVLSKASYSNLSNSPAYQAVKEIRCYLMTEFEIELNEAEFDNLHLIVYNNVTLPVTSENGGSTIDYIGEIYMEITKKLLLRVSEVYYIEPFEEPFLSQFAIHVKNLFLRAKNKYQAKNPLTQRIKLTCPFIYDLSVFIAQQLHTDYQIFINEDEIAFISFHIGGYFENSLQYHNRLNCLFIYADYYNMHLPVLEKIVVKFGNYLMIKNSISLRNYSENMSADIIVSTIDIPFKEESIIISPLFTAKDMENLERKVLQLYRKKSCVLAKRMLAPCFYSSLFYKMSSIPDKFETLAMLADYTYAKGYASKAFKEDILMREKASSTAFYQVAIPHNMQDTVYQNSISVVLLDKPAKWDEGKEIRLILLLAVNKHSKKNFSMIFDFLVEVLSEAECIERLSECSDFAEFVDTLYHLIDESFG